MVLLSGFMSAISAALSVSTINFTTETQLDTGKQRYCHNLRNLIFSSQTSNDASGKKYRLGWKPKNGTPSYLGQRMKDVFGQPTVDWLSEASVQDVVDACGLAAMGVSADDLDAATWKRLSTTATDGAGDSTEKASTSDGTSTTYPAYGPCLKMSWFAKHVLPKLAFVAFVIIGVGSIEVISWVPTIYKYVCRQWSNADRVALSDGTQRTMAESRAAKILHHATSLWEEIVAHKRSRQRVHAPSEDDGAHQTCGAAKPHDEADLVMLDDSVENAVKKDGVDDFEMVESGRDIEMK